MKYNELNRFEDFLIGEYTATTAATYKKAMDFLLQDQYLFDCHNLDVEKVIHKLKTIKYKNQYSKYKNAFLKFCLFLDIKLDEKTRNELDLLNAEKIKKRRKLIPVELDNILNRLKIMKDKKLRYSFETMLNTGLRVSELSQIKKEDCIIEKNTIVFNFTGKGGKKEKVIFYSNQDQRLFIALKTLIENTKGNKVFYSVNYLQKKANENGFCCHDLRRAYAKINYKKHHDINQTKTALRHKDIKNTRIYVNSKVKI